MQSAIQLFIGLLRGLKINILSLKLVYFNLNVDQSVCVIRVLRYNKWQYHNQRIY